MELDKEEIKIRLHQSGLINRFKTDEVLWHKAFNLYNSVTGNKLKPNCGSCFKVVKEWLMK